jgi:serine-type D-Ala-D-Ala carboxypeptidase (penicillin-binding protein 5/6)
MHLQRRPMIRTFGAPKMALGATFGAALAALMIWTAPAHAIEVLAKQAILIDYQTGMVLLEKNADQKMTPSSMSKMATVYKAFQQIKEGRLSLEDTMPVSEKAWRKQGSKMFVMLNTRVKVEDLLRGIIVQSGNDACIVIAEGLSGTEAAFANELNEVGRKIGMTNTNLVNASGWPDPGHESTARDLATLAIATIRDFPEFYRYYAEKDFVYNGIKQGNRDPLLYKDVGADGLKTGHTEEGGYGITASAVRNGRRLVLVVNGLKSVNERAREAERLLDYGFREFNNYALFNAGQTVTEAPVWLGTEAKVPLVVKDSLLTTMPVKARKDMVVKATFDSPLAAPIMKGQRVGTIRIEAPEMPVREVPLLAGETVDKLGVMSRLSAALKYIVWGEHG